MTKMSQKQTAFFLADYARQNSLTLTAFAFTCDGSFFVNSPDTITMGLFGCKSEKPECKTLLDFIRASTEKFQMLGLLQSTEVRHLFIPKPLHI